MTCAGGCFVGQATGGVYPQENSWKITNSKGDVVAQSTATGASTFCLDSTCPTCVAGSYYSVDGKACVPCPAGRYKDDAGPAVDCYKCETGKYNDNNGSVSESDCLSCGLGMYLANSGAISGATCSECEPGKYGPSENNIACTECGAGKYNEIIGSVSESDCLC